jgi:hypothetical protein
MAKTREVKARDVKKGAWRQPARRQLAELRSLAGLPDWSGAKRGLFYRPVKRERRA